MRTNTLKQKLKDGKPGFGVMITFPSPAVVEMLGYMGFDWVLIDNEHGSITIDTAEDMVRAAELSGIAPIVRPVTNKPEVIALSWTAARGACRFRTSTRVRKPKRRSPACKYFPEGQRGMFSGGRPARYGIGGSTPDYVQKRMRKRWCA
jgi:4-hydroxy-2-oxoheptanedioate aldolase